MTRDRWLIRIDPKKSFDFWLIYFLLLFKAGFFFVENYNVITAPFFLLILVMSALFNHVTVEKKVFYVTAINIALIFVCNLFHGTPEINVITLTMINLLTAMCLVSAIDLNTFEKNYCKVIYCICIVSIIGYLILTLNSSVLNILPRFTNSTGRSSYFLIFSMVADFRFAGAHRIQGIFWEPGAFQTFITVAFLVEFFHDFGFKNYTRRRIVYSLSLLLTFSTTGIVCLCLIWVLVLGKYREHFKTVRIILLVIVIITIYMSLRQKLTGFWRYTLVDKIQQMLHYTVGTQNEASSRMDSIVLPLKYFNDPIFGIGENGYNYIGQMVGHTMFTCTPINYIVKYGVIFGAISYCGIIKLICKDVTSKMDFALVLATILISVSTENYLLNCIMTIFILYGFKEDKYELDNI